jgi:type II secretory pathway component PulF
MSSLKAKINFYRSIATMLDAGVPVAKALRHNYQAPFTRVGHAMADEIEEHGGSLADGAALFPRIIEPYERRLINAGEFTGHLETILISLAERHEKSLQAKQKIIGQLIYPLFLYHFAAMAIPMIKALINGGGIKGINSSLAAPILIAWAMPYLIYFGGKALLRISAAMSENGVSMFDSFLLYMPVVGGLIRKQNYTRFFDAFSMAANAGMRMTDAVSLGASVCKNNFIKNSFKRSGEYIEENNCPLYEALGCFIFPRDRDSVILTMLETGEMTGKTAEITAKISSQCEEEANYALGIVANLVPKIIYICIVIYIALAILGAWGKMASKMTSI